MNRRLFNAELELREYSKKKIARLIGKRYDTVLRKVNSGTFSQPEIRLIIEEWELTPDQAFNIFFTD